MAIGSGLAAQFGFAAESAYGTFATPTRFLPFVSEGLKLDIERDEAEGLLGKSTTLLRTDAWAAGAKAAGGPMKFIVENKGFGLLFKHMLGGVAITTPSGGTNTRDHTHTLSGLTGLSFTNQLGRPDVSGTVQPFSYLGSKIAEWELSNSVKGFLELGLTFDCKDETTSEALASASYAASVTPLHWAGASVTISGSAYASRGISLKGNNGMESDRYALGSQTKSEPLQEKLRDITGEIDSEFLNLTAYNRFVSGTTAAIVAKWEGPTIEGAFKYMVEVTLPACRFDGDTPNVDGPKRLEQKLPFKVLNNGTAEPITIVYRTIDTAS